MKDFKICQLALIRNLRKNESGFSINWTIMEMGCFRYWRPERDWDRFLETQAWLNGSMDENQQFFWLLTLQWPLDNSKNQKEYRLNPSSCLSTNFEGFWWVCSNILNTTRFIQRLTKIMIGHWPWKNSGSVKKFLKNGQSICQNWKRPSMKLIRTKAVK